MAARNDRRLDRLLANLRAHVAELRHLESTGAKRSAVQERRALITHPHRASQNQRITRHTKHVLAASWIAHRLSIGRLGRRSTFEGRIVNEPAEPDATSATNRPKGTS
jgi:hypothetical protein